MAGMVAGRPIQGWMDAYPIIKDIVQLKPVSWMNPNTGSADQGLPGLKFQMKDIQEAEDRWRRFAPLLAGLFPETAAMGGIIESQLIEIPEMREALQGFYRRPLKGRLYLKCDNYLPVAGSIKARGGIYEVLKHAEGLALEEGLIALEDDYSVMGGERFKEFFGRCHLAVGSTGNLGMSIGIMGSALGFKVTVHMSADAKEWKKELLRSRGVEVIEYKADYSKAVEEGRRRSQRDPMSHFVDDENSRDLFMGYSVAALRLKKQLEEAGLPVAPDSPVCVYLPCGVGGAPGGICFGLKHVFGDAVRCYFVEPTHSPCMLLGMVTGLHEGVSVGDFGIDNITDADGLAVGRPSGLVGRLMEGLLDGIYTVRDDDLYRLLAMLGDSQDIWVEPSAAAGLLGPVMVPDAPAERCTGCAVHIAWATGGLFVPEDMMQGFYERGRAGLKEKHPGHHA